MRAVVEQRQACLMVPLLSTARRYMRGRTRPSTLPCRRPAANGLSLARSRPPRCVSPTRSSKRCVKGYDLSLYGTLAARRCVACARVISAVRLIWVYHTSQILLFGDRRGGAISRFRSLRPDDCTGKEAQASAGFALLFVAGTCFVSTNRLAVRPS